MHYTIIDRKKLTELLPKFYIISIVAAPMPNGRGKGLYIVTRVSLPWDYEDVCVDAIHYCTSFIKFHRFTFKSPVYTALPERYYDDIELIKTRCDETGKTFITCRINRKVYI